MKITDTCKRTIKFQDVYLEDGKLIDEEGNVLSQIVDNLPKDTECFDIQVTVFLSPEGDIE